MKRFMMVILVGMLCCGMLSGCSDTGTQNAVPEVQPEKTMPTAAQANVEIVDLTQLSSTMVYAEVYNMLTVPEEYVGKTIKATGQYNTNYNAELDVYYHFVIIEDAAACCAQGLEFILTGDHTYPDDYPANKALVEVTGVWGSYEEEGNPYYYIAVDGMKLL